MVSYIKRVPHLDSMLNSMGFEIDNQDRVMATFKGLPRQYENITRNPDSLGDDGSLDTLEIVEESIAASKPAEGSVFPE